MSVEVMGNGSLKRPWDDEGPHDFERRQTDTLPTSAFARTFSADSHPQGEQRLPSLAATLGRSEQQERLLPIQPERDSTYTNRDSSLSCSVTSPKRPRLLRDEFGKDSYVPTTEYHRHDASDVAISVSVASRDRVCGNHAYKIDSRIRLVAIADTTLTQTPDRNANQGARYKDDHVVAPVGAPFSGSGFCTRCSNTEDLVQKVVSGVT